MATSRQINANRANARRSTGPRTVAGRAKSSANARRHGLSSKFDPTAGDVIEAARTLFPGMRFAFGSEGPDDRQISALRVAAADLRVQKIRARQADIDTQIDEVLASAEIVAEPRARGLKALYAELGFSGLPSTVIRAATRIMVIHGDLELLDPLNLTLCGQALLKRYRREADAARRAAMDALEDDLVALIRIETNLIARPEKVVAREADSGDHMT